MNVSNNKSYEKQILEKLIVSKFAESIYQIFDVFDGLGEQTKSDLLTIVVGFVIFTQAKDGKEVDFMGSGKSKASQEFIRKILAFINSELGK